jgi:hypothetical protein
MARSLSLISIEEEEGRTRLKVPTLRTRRRQAPSHQDEEVNEEPTVENRLSDSAIDLAGNMDFN